MEIDLKTSKNIHVAKTDRIKAGQSGQGGQGKNRTLVFLKAVISSVRTGLDRVDRPFSLFPPCGKKHCNIYRTTVGINPVQRVQMAFFSFKIIPFNVLYLVETRVHRYVQKSVSVKSIFII